MQSGEEAGEALLALPRQDLPDAVVSANDQMAIGVVKALAREGIRVPEDIAVVGFDDIFPGSLCDPPLTTIHQPMRLLGERACARLLDRIADPSLRPATELLPTELVLRSSCGCPPGTVIRQPVPTLKFPRSEITGALAFPALASPHEPPTKAADQPARLRRPRSRHVVHTPPPAVLRRRRLGGADRQLLHPAGDAGQRRAERDGEVPQPAARGLQGASRRCWAWDIRARSGASTCRT